MNVCSLLEIPFVTHQVSQPYKSIDLTLMLMLKIRMLFTLYAECSAVQCSRSPHRFQANQRLSCFSDPCFDILICASACS
ncbi:unnamed protein product [Heterobilharzia americana]|nr:unnamed protein product [Heterobilharzia americana]